MTRRPPHVLERQQWVATPLDEVFGFFSAAENLERLTPPWLGFRIETPRPIAMTAGTLIDYTVRLGPLPMRWRTLIEVWEPPHRFVDVQVRGPYDLWYHTHTFRGLDGGTLITDTVRYRLPLGSLGRLTHGAWVRASLAAIFDYRFGRIKERFAVETGSSAMAA